MNKRAVKGVGFDSQRVYSPMSSQRKFTLSSNSDGMMVYNLATFIVNLKIPSNSAVEIEAVKERL